MNQSEIVSIIIQTINTIFSNFFSSIDASIYDNLDNLVFFNSNIMSNNFIQKLLGNSNNSFIYSLRYIFTEVLILFTPFAFLSLINSSSSWIFKNWFKSLFSLLLIQVFIPLVIIVILSINNNKVLYVGGIYALVKINDYIKEIFGGVSLNINQNFSSILSFLKK